MKRRMLAVLVIGTMVAAVQLPAAAQMVRVCDGLVATIVGTSGDDVLTGTPGPDVIAALQGNDIIDGGGGDDVICGGKGDDIISGGEGFDIIFGAQGNDRIYSADGTTEQLREDVRGARMFGGAGNDIIHGSNRWDRMQGGPGNDMLYGYEGRDWMRAGADNDQVDGGLGIDDLHGGNGRDTLWLTDGDSVRGGAGLDVCNIAAGRLAQIISCGRNVREGELPEPIFLRSESFSGAVWDFKILGLFETGANEPGRCYLLVSEIAAVATPAGSEFASGADHKDFSVQVDGEMVYNRNVCDTDAAEALGYVSLWQATAPQGDTVAVYQQFFIPSSASGTIEAILTGDPRLGNRIDSYPARFLPYLPSPSVG